MRSAQVVPFPPSRFEAKKRYAPVGDQRGLVLSVPGEVYRCGSPPAVLATQTSLWRLFSASRTVVTVNATRLPSGESAGELTVVRRYQSAGVNARLFAAGAACCARAGTSGSETAARTAREQRMRMTIRGRG